MLWFPEHSEFLRNIYHNIIAMLLRVGMYTQHYCSIFACRSMNTALWQLILQTYDCFDVFTYRHGNATLLQCFCNITVTFLLVGNVHTRVSRTFSVRQTLTLGKHYCKNFCNITATFLLVGTLTLKFL